MKVHRSCACARLRHGSSQLRDRVAEPPGSGTDWRLQLAGVTFASALAYLPVALALPFLPIVLRGQGHSAAAVGAVIAAEGVTAMAIRPFVTTAAARFGQPRIFAWACLLTAVATLANAFAGTLVVLVAARLVLGIASGTSRAIAHVWAVDVAPENQRGRALGLTGLANTGAVAAAPPLGYLLITHGASTVWLLGACTAVIAVPIGLVSGGHGEGAKHEDPGDAPSAFAGLMLSLRAGLAVAASYAGYAALATFAAVALAGRGISHGATVLTAYGATLVACRVLVGGLPDRFGGRTVAFACSVLEAVGIAAVAFAPSLPVALAGGAATGAGMANMYPSLGLLALERLTPSRRAAVAATLGSFVDLGLACGAALAGLIAAHFGPTSAIAVMGLAAGGVVGGVVSASKGQTAPALGSNRIGNERT